MAKLMQAAPTQRITVGVDGEHGATGMTGLSRAHLYRAMEAGELRFLKAGRRRLIRVDELERYIEALSVS